MTVASELAKSGPYSGDGVTTVFTVGFYFLADADLLVTKKSATGTETALTLSTDYAVSGAGVPAGGSVTLNAALAVGEKLSITRAIPITQGTTLPEGGIFPSQTVEQRLDAVVMAIQRIAEKVGRALVLPVNTLLGQPSLEDLVAGGTLVVNAAADGIEMGPDASDIADAAANAAIALAAKEIAVAAGGYKYTYDSTVTAADPGAGKLRFNNAALASATALYISETTGNAQAVGADIATWDDPTSTIRGRLRIFKQADPTVFAIFNITGALTDNGAWDTLTVAYVAGSGSLTTGDAITVEYARIGDKGDTGATGSTGPAGSVPVAAAGGTANALTADFTPDLTLTDKTVCIVIAASANSSTTPTFAPDGLTARTITRQGGQALLVGDITGAGHALLFEYNLANTRWELMNPGKVRAANDIVGSVPEANGGTNQTAYAQGDILYASGANTLAKLPKGTGLQKLRMNAGATAPEWATDTSGGAINIQNFTASGTWTKPGSGTWAFVQIWGAGGSGGSTTSTTNRGGGGGGGAYTSQWFPLSLLGSTETVTIGAGGTGIATNTAGNVGGNSTFGSKLTGYGGGAGNGGANICGGGGGGGMDAAGPSGSAVNTGNAGGGSFTGGAQAVPDAVGSTGLFGGGSGAGGGNTNVGKTGGSATNGGGGGGSASFSSASAGGAGGASVMGGAGGGGSSGSGTGGTGGTSIAGGNGGAGGNNSTNGTAGSQPGGGGGGSANSFTSGAGAAGQCIVMVF